jgi:hypothetical protein
MSHRKKAAGSTRAVQAQILALFLAFTAFATLAPTRVHASLTCQEEVTKIELMYSVADQRVTAQITLKNNIALKWVPKTEKDEQMLLEIIKIFGALDIGGRRSKMFLTVEEDQVKAFKVITASTPALCC